MTDSQHLTNDPEILALLDFQAVPRRCKKEGGWTAEMQRLFIAKLAVHGSPGKACDELGMYRSGIDKVFKSEGAESFRAAWAAAVELADRRRIERVAAGHADVANLKMPFVDNRRKGPATVAADAMPREPIGRDVRQMRVRQVCLHPLHPGVRSGRDAVRRQGLGR
jgi:hypothetical protein